MNFYNMMTCEGNGWSTSILGDCSMAWIGFTLLIFLCLILRRQCEDGFLSGTGFNVIGAFAGSLVTYIVVVALTGSARWALVAGVVGLAAGGFGIGLIADSGGGGDSGY